MKRLYIPALISIIALAGYFAPWYGDPRANLVYYLFAFFWFLLAWIPMIVQLVLSILRKRSGEDSWRHHLVSAALVALCYVGLLIGLSKGYMLTA